MLLTNGCRVSNICRVFFQSFQRNDRDVTDLSPKETCGRCSLNHSMRAERFPEVEGRPGMGGLPEVEGLLEMPGFPVYSQLLI